MDIPKESLNPAPPQELLIRADEVDAGTTILSPAGQKPLSALGPNDGASTARPKPPPRPSLRREGSTPPPPPPSQPPPAPPGQLENVTDSLSLPQLRQLVSQFPKTEQRAYAFVYEDAESFVEEIDEWFHYTEIEQDRDYLLAAREAFEQKWRSYCHDELNAEDESWVECEPQIRRTFVELLRPDITSDDVVARQESVASIFYILLGVWSVTAGIEDKHNAPNLSEEEKSNSFQIEWIHNGVDLIIDTNILEPLYKSLRTALDKPLENANLKVNGEDGYEGAFDDTQYREVSFFFSCFYIILESSRSRSDKAGGRRAREVLLSLNPNFLVFMSGVISRLRWDESYNIPLMHALQILWKSVLLAFGNIKEHLEQIKEILQLRSDPFSSEASKPILTASPLDYHLFRQEITSKYPSYNPPLPLIPIDVEQKTMLPPLPHQALRQDGFDAIGKASVPPGSIMHQPVHIATPAPSPPPSPAGPGGKGGKKQNYQTNQNFPFLYPPLDDASNKIGGKGTTEFQDAMCGRKWEGSDIPASIIEAGELFSSRMRMTRAMRQLWKARDLFMKYDRGWNDKNLFETEDSRKGEKEKLRDEVLQDTLQNPDLQQRLDAVEEFFHQSLPDLQSLVIVMMKVMLTNVQDIAVRNGQLQENLPPQSALNRNKSSQNLNQTPNSLPTPPPPPRPHEVSLEDLDNIRSREISQKAILSCIFLMLKWFKISHVLKFEYMTQLLLDSNYIQLTLKYFAHQNLEDLVAFKYDRDDLSFWRYCQQHSDHPPLSPTSPQHQSDEEGSEDEAVPPPIQRHRPPSTSAPEGTASTMAQPSLEINTSPMPNILPAVDELGNPLTDLPPSPITTFSSRQFHTAISLLRILQKVTRAKSHRILLLVQFKSSQILRRILHVPEPMLRLYVLKLFKSQVPYCGRKWRQSNMRVITAIYLHCRPELRDEWLAGMHDSNMDSEVDEAVPLEWGLRGLTFWWQKRTYPDIMKLKVIKPADKNAPTATEHESKEQMEMGGQEIEDEERDFFQRELDAMGWGLAGIGLGDGEDVGFGEEAPGMGMEAAPTSAINGINGQHHVQYSSGTHGDSWS